MGICNREIYKMKSEEEILERIEQMRNRAFMYYKKGNIGQAIRWDDSADILEWVLEESEEEC
jgi:hypothetical protein